jgi:hypothetical protein
VAWLDAAYCAWACWPISFPVNLLARGGHQELPAVLLGRYPPHRPPLPAGKQTADGELPPGRLQRMQRESAPGTTPPCVVWRQHGQGLSGSGVPLLLPAARATTAICIRPHQKPRAPYRINWPERARSFLCMRDGKTTARRRDGREWRKREKKKGSAAQAMILSALLLILRCWMCTISARRGPSMGRRRPAAHGGIHRPAPALYRRRRRRRCQPDPTPTPTPTPLPPSSPPRWTPLGG